MQLKSLKVERAAEELIKPKGTYDIQCYKCFINTYAVLKYEILILVLVENMICRVNCSWRRCPWHPRGGHS
jgi:hypothetical protein